MMISPPPLITWLAAELATGTKARLFDWGAALLTSMVRQDKPVEFIAFTRKPHDGVVVNPVSESDDAGSGVDYDVGHAVFPAVSGSATTSNACLGQDSGDVRGKPVIGCNRDDPSQIFSVTNMDRSIAVKDPPNEGSHETLRDCRHSENERLVGDHAPSRQSFGESFAGQKKTNKLQVLCRIRVSLNRLFGGDVCFEPLQMIAVFRGERDTELRSDNRSICGNEPKPVSLGVAVEFIEKLVVETILDRSVRSHSFNSALMCCVTIALSAIVSSA